MSQAASTGVFHKSFSSFHALLWGRAHRAAQLTSATLPATTTTGAGGGRAARARPAAPPPPPLPGCEAVLVWYADRTARSRNADCDDCGPLSL